MPVWFIFIQKNVHKNNIMILLNTYVWVRYVKALVDAKSGSTS